MTHHNTTPTSDVGNKRLTEVDYPTPTSAVSLLPSELLRFLGRGAPHGCYWHKAGRRTQWYSTDTIPRPEQWKDVYFGVHPCGAIPPGDPYRVRSQNDFIGAVNCLYADLDYKNLGGEDATKDHIASLILSPNVVIQSGGGYHVYWLLDEPVTFHKVGEPDAVRDYVSLLQRKWVYLVGGDRGACDLARILRVPNSLNCKMEYQAPRRVEIVYADLTWGYRLIDIRALVDGAQDEVDSASLSRTVTGSVLSGYPGVAGILTYLARQKVGSRNAVTYWAACRLRTRGVPVGDADDLIVPIAVSIGLAEREAQRTVRSAYR